MRVALAGVDYSRPRHPGGPRADTQSHNPALNQTAGPGHGHGHGPPVLVGSVAPSATERPNRHRSNNHPSKAWAAGTFGPLSTSHPHPRRHSYSNVFRVVVSSPPGYPCRDNASPCTHCPCIHFPFLFNCCPCDSFSLYIAVSQVAHVLVYYSFIRC